MKKYTRTQNRQSGSAHPEAGFTIIETLVAIFILIISITGPLTFAQSGLRASFVARDQVVAFYLAQDVIETIKNIRDNEGLDGEGGQWLESLDECRSSTGCSMDTANSSISIQSCTIGTSCRPLDYDKNEREFIVASSRTGGAIEPSKYTRTIYIHDVVPEKEVQIVVEVKWDSNFFSNRRIVVQENIYNWVPEYTI